MDPERRRLVEEERARGAPGEWSVHSRSLVDAPSFWHVDRDLDLVGQQHRLVTDLDFVPPVVQRDNAREPGVDVRAALGRDLRVEGVDVAPLFDAGRDVHLLVVDLGARHRQRRVDRHQRAVLSRVEARVVGTDHDLRETGGGRGVLEGDVERARDAGFRARAFGVSFTGSGDCAGGSSRSCSRSRSTT